MKDWLTQLPYWAPYAGLGGLVLFMLLLYWFFRSGLRRLAAEIAEAYSWALLVVTWVFPGILVAIAWCFVTLHDNGLLAALQTGGGVTVGVLGILWIFFVQLPLNNEPGTSLPDLKHSFFVSAAWSLATACYALHTHASQGWQPWLVFPAAIVCLNLFVSTNAAFNNAFSKNPTIMRGS